MTDLSEPADPGTPPRPGLRIHPPEIWELAQRDYLDGHSGPAICARYGLGLAAFRKRAASGGWRRIDQPAPMPMAPIQIDGDLDEADYFDLAEMSAIHLREAIVNGRVGEAAAWLRLHLRLHDASDQEFVMHAAMERERAARPAASEAVDGVDGIDGILTAGESTLSPGTRPPPETPAPPPSSPGPKPGCGAESGQSGR